MGHQEVVSTLVAAGARAHESTPYGWTALMFAQDCGQAEIAETLALACKPEETVSAGLVSEFQDATALVA